jgi:hypothetical protein
MSPGKLRRIIGSDKAGCLPVPPSWVNRTGRSRKGDAWLKVATVPFLP